MSVDTDSWYPNLADPCDAVKVMIVMSITHM